MALVVWCSPLTQCKLASVDFEAWMSMFQAFTCRASLVVCMCFINRDEHPKNFIESDSSHFHHELRDKSIAGHQKQFQTETKIG